MTITDNITVHASVYR